MGLVIRIQTKPHTFVERALGIGRRVGGAYIVNPSIWEGEFVEGYNVAFKIYMLGSIDFINNSKNLKFGPVGGRIEMIQPSTPRHFCRLLVHLFYF